tara:strand:- start:120 stop:1262 length:1143 start_codon:yes stop_codon:yes gene_type:complete
MEEEFDLSAFKVVDENGEAQPVDIPQAESPEETPETEEVKEETEVENTSEEQTEVEETPVAETEVEEPAEEAEKEIGKPDELFSQLDAISKDLSNGKAENLEDFFDEYKRMRDSSSAEFKDDFIKNAVEYYNETGNLTPYLEATSVNYSEMSDEKVMRRDLEQANPTLSKGAIERLYTREIVDKYSLDEDKFDEDEVELGKELLAADATKLRDKYVDEQKNFTQPVKEQTEETETVNQEEQRAKWTETVSSHEKTKDVMDNKRILVSYGDEKFSYEVENPESLQEMTIDNNKFFDLFKDDKGDVDFDKWYRVLAYASDPEVYDSSLISHGQELGQEKVVSDLKNPTAPTKSSRDYKKTESPFDGLFGALSRGDSDVKIIR